MKLFTNINTKKIFRSKKSRSISRSDPPSFSSGTTSSSDSSDVDLTKSKLNGLDTPTSVLPAHSHEKSVESDEWSQISADVNFELIQAFKIIDRDGDGKITRSELRALLSRIGAEPPTEDEIDLMLSELDRDGEGSGSGSGSISVEKVDAISSAFEPPPCHDELRETFHFFDTDHDGKITPEELFRFFTSIGDGRCTFEDCRRMINGVDKNGDGVVCFEDFTRMMEQQR